MTENKNSLVKYIVTDPCYLLPRNTWDKCCEVFKNDDEFMYDRFDEEVSKALSEFTEFPAYACGTGYGDWSNSIWGDGVIKQDFVADAGMVSVCRLTDKVLQHLKEKYGEANIYSGLAIFEMSENIRVDFDVSNSNWTVVKIKDLQTGETIQSESADEDEEDYWG